MDTDVSSLSSTGMPSKRPKVLKKRRAHRRSRSPTLSDTSPDEHSDNEAAETTKITNVESELISKKRKKSFQRIQNTSMDDEEEDEEENSICSSVASPQPLGDQLPLLKPTSKEHDNLINMGGKWNFNG